MSTNRKNYALTLMIATLVLSGCGSGMGGCTDKGEEELSGPKNYDSSSAQQGEDTQYTEPTMANLQGKPQPFPSRYLLKQYPNSRVVMAWVKPNLKPGHKNLVLLSSTDAKPNIAVYYKQDMVKDGWELTYQNENSCFSQTIWRKKTNGGIQEAEVRVSPDPYGKQAVQLLCGPYRPMLDYTRADGPKKW
jgi:hypothetical protein